MSKEQNTHYLGSNLRLLSAAYDLTNRQIAEEIGIDTSHVSRIMNYKSEDKRRPSVDVLVGLANLFDTDLETLIRVDLVGELKEKVKRK